MIFGLAQDRRGQVGIGPGGGPLIGGHYTIELRGPLAAEVRGYLMQTDRVVLEAVSGAGLQPLGDADALVAAMDARMRFTLTGARTWHGLAPFVLLGGGIVGDLAGPSPLEASLAAGERFSFGPSFLGTFGAGTRWIPGERVTLRFESTLQIWKLSTPAGFMDVEGEARDLVDEQWLGAGAFTLGVSYRF